MSTSNNSKEKYDILPVLEKQLRDGYYDGYYEIPDLQALFFVEDTILTNNGYKKITEQEFVDKLKTIFKIKLDNIKDVFYFIDEEKNNCTKLNTATFEDAEDDGIYIRIYISGENNFITPLFWLPEIIDYKKTPNLIDVEIEKNRDTRYWKDIDDLPKKRRFNQQLLVSRNKYLFNNDKSQFIWLTYNDESFMKSLITIFGYTEDKKLLNWVMEKNHSQPEKITDNIIFVKNCQGKLEIREDILKYIEGITTNDEAAYAIELKHTIVQLLTNKQSGKDINWTDEELYKIVAYSTNYIDPLYWKYRRSETVVWGNGSIMDIYFHLLTEKEREAMEEQYKRNNYYNLPHLKDMIEEVRYL